MLKFLYWGCKVICLDQMKKCLLVALAEGFFLLLYRPAAAFWFSIFFPSWPISTSFYSLCDVSSPLTAFVRTFCVQKARPSHLLGSSFSSNTQIRAYHL